MLSVGTLTESQSTDIFKNSDSIKLIPVVSAEWNHNLFNPPYITTAGTGAKISGVLTSGTVADVTVGAKENFTTKPFVPFQHSWLFPTFFCSGKFRKK